MNPLVLITVNYDNYSDTDAFVESLLKQTSRDFKLVVVDISKNKIKKKYPTFTHIIPAENKGYAHGLNVGLRFALGQGFERFSFINNDTKVKSNFIAQVTRSLSENPSSLIGGKIYYYPGFEYHNGKYAKKDVGKVIWYAGGILDWRNVFTIHRGVDEVDKGQYDTFETTDFVTGCLMNFDKSFFSNVGYMDESYFLYYEDADWCERTKQKKCKIFYDPKIVIWHKNGQSTGGSGSMLQIKYQERNRIKFGLRHAPWRTKIHLIKNYFIRR